MKANEFKFKVTNKDGISAIISLADVSGYGGCCIVADGMPEELDYAEINDELDFEYISNEGEI